MAEQQAARAAAAAQAAAAAAAAEEIAAGDTRCNSQSEAQDRKPADDKKLDDKAADKAARARGYKNAEDAKEQNNAVPSGHYDLYQGKDGTIYIKRKGGAGPGEPI